MKTGEVRKLLSGGRVVIVGDDPGRCGELEEILEGHGFETLRLTDEALGGECCRDFAPDVVVFWHNDFADINCFSKRCPHDSGCYVLVVHDSGVAGRKRQAIAKGADEFLGWPLEADELIHRVTEAIKARRRWAEISSNREQLESALEAIRAHNTAFDIELEEARAIQHVFLPSRRRALNGFGINFMIRPAQKLCGDFIDIIRLGRTKIATILLDVSGHGAPAAMVTGMAHAWLRSMLSSQANLEFICYLLNRYLLEFTPEFMFATAFIGILDTDNGRLEYVLAGHPEPIIWQAGQCFPLPEAVTPPFGLFEDFTPVIRRCELAPGEALLVYSDGLLDGLQDTENPLRKLCELYACHNRFGCLRNRRCIMVDDIMSLGDAAEDDMSLLCISRFPRPLSYCAMTLDIPAVDHYRFALESSERAIADLHDFLSNNLKDEIGDELFWDILQVTGELLHNALEWGHHFDRSKTLRYTIELGEEEIVVEVEDQGEGFDHRRLSGLGCKNEPFSAYRPDGKRPGGFGLLLCRDLAESLEFNERGNRVTARFRYGGSLKLMNS